MFKIRRPLGRLIFNMGIAIPGKTVFLIETAPWFRIHLPEIEGRYQNVCIGVSIMITVSSVGAKQGTRLFLLEPPLLTWINLNPIMDK